MGRKKKNENNENEVQRAVIYARYSDGPDQRDESIVGQLRDCRRLAKELNCVVVKEYIDKGISGRTTEKRPEFQQMLRDGDKKLFDVVITWKMDRLSRNRYDSATIKQRLKKSGIKIRYAKEHIPDGPEGILMESVLEGMAEWYSANLAQNVRRGMYDSALEGKHVAGSVPFGLLLDENKHYIIDEKRAPIVREVFERYAKGEPVTHITEDLNRRGIKKRYKPYTWGKTSLRSLIKNEKYIGIYRYEDIELNCIPPIVSKELFEAAAKRVKAPQRSNSQTLSDVDYMLTGKLFCGECGDTMHGMSGTGKSGRKWYYYACHSQRARKCHKKSIRKDELEQYVIRETVDTALQPQIMEYIVNKVMEIQRQEKDNSVLRNLQKELKDTEDSISNILKAIEKGVFSESISNRLNELEQQKQQLIEGIAAEEYQTPHYTEEELYFWLEQFKDGEIEDRHYQKTIISKFVHSVYVFDDKIKIAYNYCKDSNSQEIQLNDIISARYCPISSSESASDEPCDMFEVCGDRSTMVTHNP